jgi:hypothetical protein
VNVCAYVFKASHNGVFHFIVFNSVKLPKSL